MKIKDFNNWINESEESIVNQNFASRLLSDVSFLRKLPKNEGDVNLHTVKDTEAYIIRLLMSSTLNKEVNRLLDLTEFETMPDMIAPSVRIRIQIDHSLKGGESKVKELYDWADRHLLVVYANPENYEQLKKVVEESIDHLFAQFKNVRLIMPANIKKIGGFSDKIKDNVKSLYDNIIDEYYETGKLPENVVEGNILAEIFTKTLLENPQYIEQINKLPESSKKRIFKSALEVFKGDSIEINQKNLSIIKSLYKAKKAWSLI